MKIKQIKDLRDAVPFKPFVIELSSGRTIPISDGDHLWIAPNKKKTLVAFDAEGHFYIVDFEHVSTLIVK